MCTHIIPWKEVGYKIKVGTEHLYLESWENLMRSPCIYSPIYTMINVFIIELKQFECKNINVDVVAYFWKWTGLAKNHLVLGSLFWLNNPAP
jgi:hypothetical protein